MPIYEYRCNNCGNKFTKLFLSNPTGNDITCEKCASKEITRLFSAFAISSGKSKSESPTCSEGKFSNHSCSSGCGHCPLGDN